MSTDFVHLRIHSEYSLTDGIVKIKPLIKKTAELGQGAVALTDICNFFGVIKFYSGCLGAGIKPIVGSDLWIAEEGNEDSPFMMTFLCQNNTGYKNLIELISRGYRTNQHHDVAIVKPEWVAELNEGLIMLSGHHMGDVGEALGRSKLELAKSRAHHWQQVFGDRYYLELVRSNRENDETQLKAKLSIAVDLGIAVVATNDVRFIDREQFEAHEARVCINEGVTLEDPKRERKYSEEQYLKSTGEMQALFADIPSAIENTVEIAKRCNVEIELGKYYLPDYPVPEGMTMDEYFRQLSAEGLENRLKQLFTQQEPNYDEIRQQYYDRLNFELDIIIQMGFPGYFLIVMDFIRWSKEHDIPVGPGRGSGAGSLVAYALDITDLDPIEYDLLFERFLNPERVSMPDFDIDFCMEKRDQVIGYVADNYGRDAVSQIVTFGTMAAKAVVRDVARVQGKSFGLADRLSKLIPGVPGMTLDAAIAEVEDLKQLVENDDEAQEVWQMAKLLEGITRQTGKHAGGVVIAPTKLTDFSPLYCDVDGSGLVTQYDKNDVESAGLVKFDFLGLRTLTIIDWALAIINGKSGQAPIDIAKIPLDDPACFKLLKEAKTTAVFQLESQGMKGLIKRLQPDSLEDMIALVALYRPGPLQSGMVEDFIDRKHGRAPLAYPHPDYQHPDLEPVLENTYGVILYQEQVQRIAQVLAGYSLGKADLLRRAMGKKKPEEMEKQRKIFLEGALENGLTADLANNIFDLMEKFAGYGFNKSHSAAYALVSYQTLWLKTHYPAAFLAATMSSDLQNTDKVVVFIEDARQMGIQIVPPDVNEGEYLFTVNAKDQIVYGLGAVKGVGEGPVEAIIQARRDGPFTDLFDFCKRVDPRKVNKRTIEALIKCGALDKIGPNRAAMMAAIENAVKAADQAQTNAATGMMDLFGVIEEEAAVDVYQPYLDIPQWPTRERLSYEKDTLGLYLTGHPIDDFEREVAEVAHMRLANLADSREPQRLVGLVVSARFARNKKGEPMAFLLLDDRTGRAEVSLFGEALEQAKPYLENDAIIVVEGSISWSDYSDGWRIRGNQVIPLAQAREQLTDRVRLVINQQLEERALEWLQRNVVDIDESKRPVTIHYQHQAGVGDVHLGETFGIAISDDVLDDMRANFGQDNVQLIFGNRRRVQMSEPEFG
ncbi:DNA polymerase III subunit alpha [Salinibius halmophilus]|uniref:DNA polymerase III subunit alpha n=1 Tax=Salinibius halmophilus TaxID=1853216 RepID=UPI000E673379|nr:DNA polymerase III subunit alpha [Salinibius halmophilus]